MTDDPYRPTPVAPTLFIDVGDRTFAGATFADLIDDMQLGGLDAERDGQTCTITMSPGQTLVVQSTSKANP